MTSKTNAIIKQIINAASHHPEIKNLLKLWKDGEIDDGKLIELSIKELSDALHKIREQQIRDEMQAW